MAKADWAKRNAFIREYVASGNGTKAAIAAGVPRASAHAVAHKWLRNPEIIALLRKEIDGRMRDLAPVAVKVLETLMLDENTPANTRLAAAKDILDRLGWVPPKKGVLSIKDETPDITQLSMEQLTSIALGYTIPK